MTVTATRTLRRALLGAALFLAATAAHAQATRTWVSGVGADENPCSRTAPCKTFAGAIAKTAAGGIISVLDPGGYGAVTITKSITIDGGGIEGSILATGTTGVVVNAGATDIVTLRNLTISGNSKITSGVPDNPGVNGIRFLAGAALHVENCQIQSFRRTSAGNGWGILVNPSTAGVRRLYVENTTIQDNGSGATGGGIHAIPTSGAIVFGVVKGSHIANNFGNGVRVGNNAAFTIEDSNVSGNQKSGVFSLASAGFSDVVLRNSTLTDNGRDAGNGSVQADGANAFVHIAGNIVSNSEIGLYRTNSGNIYTYGDNQVVSNTMDGTTNGNDTEL
jgi:hypothetical protein